MKQLLSKYFAEIVLSVIVLLGFSIRIKGVIEGSFAFTYDVGRDMLAVWNIVVNHQLLFIGPTTGLPGVFYGPWWYYLLAPAFVAGSGDPKGVATFIVLLGMATVIGGFYLGRKVSGKTLGIILAGLLAFSPIMLGLTTQIWNPNIAPFITLLIIIILAILSGVKKQDGSKKHVWLFFFLGILLALNFDAEIVYGALFFLSIVISFVVLLRNTFSLQRIIAFGLGFILILSPRILFELKHQFLMTRTLLSSFTGKLPGGSELPFLERLPQRLEVLGQMWIDTVSLSNWWVGGVLAVLVIATILRYFPKLSQVKQKLVIVLSITLVTFYVGLLFFSHDIWSHYFVGLPVVFILLLGLGIDALLSSLPRFRTLLLSGVVLLIIANFNPLKVIGEMTKPLWIGDASVYRNQLVAIDYVYQEASGRPFKYLVYTPPIYDYPYQYLFIWYGEKEYQYVPDQNENKLFFVILEPDPEYPFRLTDWLEERKNDGRIVKQTTLESGIIVQTRVNP